MDYQFRLREAEEEKRFQKLDEMIRNQQKAREEIAASQVGGLRTLVSMTKVM